MSSNLPTQERVLELLDYDPTTGIFQHKAPRARAIGKDSAGCKRKDGYIVINVDGRPCRAHQLAWLIVFGKWPQRLDHINRQKDDNRICNLREATQAENLANRVHYAGKPITGVRWAAHAKKWMARTAVGGKTKFLGYFHTREEAEATYWAKRREMFPEFTP